MAQKKPEKDVVRLPQMGVPKRIMDFLKKESSARGLPVSAMIRIIIHDAFVQKAGS